MSLKLAARKNLEFARQCFENTTKVLTEEDGGFAPTPEAMTVTGQVVHVAQTLDWLREGGFDGVWKMEFEVLAAEMPANPIMQGPRYEVIGGVVDHTAHHRGALAVYARLQGKTPAMPYGEG